MFFSKAERLNKIPPYLFVEIDKLKKKMISQGKDLIDLGIGDPDNPPPTPIIEELSRTAFDPKNHRYPLDLGLKNLREKISSWFFARFNVNLDPDKEILPLIGSKEGIAHFPLAVLNSQDIAIIPEPLYPPYRSGAIFAGSNIFYLPLKEENNFYPNFREIPNDVLKKAKLLYLNYPNNPTSAIATIDFFEEAVNFAYKNNLILLHDAAYSEISFDDYIAPSILQIKGAKDIAIEFHSFSKTFNMTGWRIGWTCGNSNLIEYLREVKSNIDSGIFTPIQYAGIKALDIYKEEIREIREIYKQRRDIFVTGLKKIGWKISKPKATFYIWAKVPLSMDSEQFCKLLLEKALIVVTPGNGFGPSGEGWVRMALTSKEERLKEAVDRISKIL
jgi:LL-diaminopimelate aminotransferase